MSNTSTYHIKAVGVTFGDRQRVIRNLHVGQPLRFVAEPNNPYDSNAVRIETLDGKQVGYISKDYNQTYSYNLQKGLVTYKAVVSSITGGGFGTSYGLNIEVTAIGK